jgi:hypothetical protein
VKGGPKNTATAYYAKPYFQPYGATWGAPFAPTEICQPIIETPGPPQTPPGGGDCGHGNQPTCPPASPTPTPTGSLLPLPTQSGVGGGGTLWFAFVPFLGPLLALLMRRRRR